MAHSAAEPLLLSCSSTTQSFGEPGSGDEFMAMLKQLLGGLLIVLVLGLGGLFIGARFSDGPLAIVAGGAFTTGDLVSDPVSDWSFVHDTQEVEFQLLDPVRSRTTWIIEHEGKAYIPSGYMTSWWGKLWKKWPIEAEKDGRILLRVDDKLYERQLVRVDSGPILAPLTAELGRKYAGGASQIPVEAVTSGYLWLFELAPRK
jgi:hypothetical protein